MSYKKYKLLVNIHVVEQSLHSGCIGKLKYNEYVNAEQIVNVTEYFEILHFEDKPEEAVLENDGNTVKIFLSYKNNKPPTLTEGLFQNETFELAFMYYLWLNHSGWNITQITPDSVIPAELHMVFINAKYGTYERAVTKKNGVVIQTFGHQVL